MKSRTLTIIMIAAATCLVFSTCKKEKEEPLPQESGQASTDSRDAQGENDIAIGDINTVIMDDANLRGRVSGQSGSSSSGTICGMSVDTTGRSTGSLTLNFDGTTCNNRTRTGQIKLAIVDYSLGKRWKQAGCVLQVQFIGYKVTRASDQKSIELNGTQLITNESGGSWWEFLIIKTQTSLIHKSNGTNLKVKFTDGKEATYNINRRITYSLPNNILTCAAEGIGSSGSLSNLENFGTTRDGEAFTSQVNTPIVWNLTCGANAPIQGNINMQVAGKGFALQCTFGTDQTGNPVSVGSNQCPYGWKLSWTVNGKTQQKILGYK